MNAAALWKRLPVDAIDRLLSKAVVRRSLLRQARKHLWNEFVVENAEERPRAVQEGRVRLSMNVLHSLHRAFSSGRLAPNARKALIRNLIGGFMLAEDERTASFRADFGVHPPATLVVSPTKRCNLRCAGCYAASSSTNAEVLPFDVVTRILREMRKLWGAHLAVLSGGEPLLYRDGDKTFFDILEGNPDSYFLVYTNGTTITEEAAQRLADLGNASPALSVEGFEAQTDGRRGQGTHRRVLQAMRHLRDAGVLFGISVTVTRNNADVVMTDRFLDFYVNDLGASYAWIFQYLPIGRGRATELMVTPEQRVALFKRQEAALFERDLLVVDFWSGGPYALGCLSAGRSGGYFHIDWNGNVAPCVFFPYSTTNVCDLYREGQTLNDIWRSPYFTAIRSWQDDYALRRRGADTGNLIVPCPFRDHFDLAREVIASHDARGMDENAAAAIEDPEYCRAMSGYGRKVRELTQGIWDAEFLGRTW